MYKTWRKILLLSNETKLKFLKCVTMLNQKQQKQTTPETGADNKESRLKEDRNIKIEEKSL